MNAVQRKPGEDIARRELNLADGVYIKAFENGICYLDDYPYTFSTKTKTDTFVKIENGEPWLINNQGEKRERLVPVQPTDRSGSRVRAQCSAH